MPGLSPFVHSPTVCCAQLSLNIYEELFERFASAGAMFHPYWHKHAGADLSGSDAGLLLAPLGRKSADLH